MPSRGPTRRRVVAPGKPLSPILVSGPRGSRGVARGVARRVDPRTPESDRPAEPLGPPCDRPDPRAATPLLGGDEVSIVGLTAMDHLHFHAGT
jgi:hypothetical protein